MNFLNDESKINLISEKELLKKLEKINAKNLEFLKSLIHPSDSNFRVNARNR